MTYLDFTDVEVKNIIILILFSDTILKLKLAKPDTRHGGKSNRQEEKNVHKYKNIASIHCYRNYKNKLNQCRKEG